MDDPVRIQIIVGSIREGRTSLPVAEWVHERTAEREDLTVEFVDLREWDFPMFALTKPPAMGDYQDPLQKRWAANVARADGFIFVAPEYNHGYSSALKNAVDYVFAEWHRKPATFVSFGNAGGARMIEQLRLVLIELQMAPLASAVHLFGAHGKLSNGRFVSGEDDEGRLDKALDELVWWAGALRKARAQQ